MLKDKNEIENQWEIYPYKTLMSTRVNFLNLWPRLIFRLGSPYMEKQQSLIPDNPILNDEIKKNQFYKRTLNKK